MKGRGRLVFFLGIPCHFVDLSLEERAQRRSGGGACRKIPILRVRFRKSQCCMFLSNSLSLSI